MFEKEIFYEPKKITVIRRNVVCSTDRWLVNVTLLMPKHNLSETFLKPRATMTFRFTLDLVELADHLLCVADRNLLSNQKKNRILERKCIECYRSERVRFNFV
jgi:hypothetical protein